MHKALCRRCNYIFRLCTYTVQLSPRVWVITFRAHNKYCVRFTDILQSTPYMRPFCDATSNELPESIHRLVLTIITSISQSGCKTNSVASKSETFPSMCSSAIFAPVTREQGQASGPCCTTHRRLREWTAQQLFWRTSPNQ